MKFTNIMKIWRNYDRSRKKKETCRRASKSLKGATMELDKIYLGDCYELIKQVPDKSIDLIITDPPYEIEGGGSAGCFGNRTYFKEYHDLGTDEHKSMEDKTDKSCAGFNYSLLEELERVMKKTNIYLWCSKRQLLPLMEFYKNKVVDVLVWCKTNPTPLVNGTFLSDIEYCVYAREKGTQLRGGIRISEDGLFLQPTPKIKAITSTQQLNH